MTMPSAAISHRQRAWTGFMRRHEALAEQQRALLGDILRRNAGTRFGQEHGFGAVKSVESYRAAVPIRHWTDMIPYVDAVLAGQDGVLTTEPPFFFHRTTGTTGTPKMIPFTRSCLALQQHTLRRWLDRAVLDNPRLLQGGTLALLNTAVEGVTERHYPYGALSGSAYFRLPPAIRRTFCHPYAAYDIEYGAARRYALLRFGIERPCSFVFSGNAAALLGLFEFADRHAEALIRDLHDGTMCSDFAVPDAIRAIVVNEFRPDPKRARALAERRRRDGRLRPADYWPDLQALGCWIGGSMGHFAPALRDWCRPGVPLRDVGYMASEGIFTIPLGNESPGGILTLHTAVFEFVPEHEFGRPDARSLLAHEVEPGQNYHIVVTNTGGLYRYAMNDVVRVTGRVAGSPVLHFLYKGGQVQNLQGEMLTVDHVVGAVTAMTSEAGLALRHFQVAAELPARRYALQIEPAAPVPAAVLPRLLQRFDRALGAVNENYATLRGDRQLAPPVLRVMKPGWFDRLTEDAVVRVRRDSQVKLAVLVAEAERPELADTVIGLPAIQP